ncbi:hypothetical protein JX266_000172 [Neoarthrinium moseri]|nr:hypothetical protein JX266_000172 [Neoarthrinium moseri]
MPPAGSAAPGGPGANPAPRFKTDMNSIAMLMAKRSQPSFLSPKPSSLSSSSSSKPPSHGQQQAASAPPQTKTPAQLAAQAEDLEVDRLAQYDDNMGLGMFKPENRREREDTRQKERDERRLRGRLGLLKGKGKGASGGKPSEWDAVSGVAAARARAESEDEDEGRSGVGRAKKRKRVAVEPEPEPELAERDGDEGGRQKARGAVDSSVDEAGDKDVQMVQAESKGVEVPEDPQVQDGDPESSRAEEVLTAKRKRKNKTKKKNNKKKKVKSQAKEPDSE